jgi:hypothetical protein
MWNKPATRKDTHQRQRRSCHVNEHLEKLLRDASLVHALLANELHLQRPLQHPVGPPHLQHRVIQELLPPHLHHQVHMVATLGGHSSAARQQYQLTSWQQSGSALTFRTKYGMLCMVPRIASYMSASRISFILRRWEPLEHRTALQSVPPHDC